MKYQEGYVYHIKDEFFTKISDENLMQNKENGNYRPTYYCMKDEKTNLIWVVPMSTKTEKFEVIYSKQKEKYGECLTIVIGEYDDKKAAFLLQNMFPITEYYLDHVHIKKGNPIKVHTTIGEIISSNMKKIREMIKRNKKVVFTDVANIERVMIAELDLEKKKEKEVV
ncbi:MAG: hypothetical protein A2Y24_00945 [Clostridiales bacterium GWE2_32_10]|nr:MAG: hypothetical protein A2Y24_00945 [Clostridiales bacterium GWE2_32_10]HBY19455.1 hypothetical protein [Clostridiales bacterium]